MVKKCPDCGTEFSDERAKLEIAIHKDHKCCGAKKGS